ncbi:MAG: right-handed parallel beta-helix repeat-containing protein [Ginsengibacter sp.]
MKAFYKKLFVLFFPLVFIISSPVFSQKFVHPGINQTLQDMDVMKKLVLEGKQPWKGAFDRLKSITDTGFKAIPHTHVIRGPYAKPNIGGDDLSRSANMAYNNAVLWYITKDRKYANQAIEILNAWSPVLWDFDYNDAKLLAAWTGHVLCNAAEILRYTNSGWQPKDIDGFTNMLMTVYYPLLRYYYPQANGNWDGAIIHAILAIGVFTDNRQMFDNAIDHFLHAPVNGSLFKYIYPSGQCQESMRDQGHVQLGLGEFAGAAQVAFTQGTDLFSIGNNRIALGYEYTAGFLLGENPHCYGGPISERAKNIGDNYEYVYRHYVANGIVLPFTQRAADTVRNKASRSILTSVRSSYGGQQNKKIKKIVKPDTTGYIAGATYTGSFNMPANAIIVEPGQSVQKALDEAAGSRRWVVAKAGIHTLPATLKIPSGVTLSGEGINTILFLDPATGARETIMNADNDLHDVAIRNLVIECGVRTTLPSDPNGTRSYRGGYNRGGILFSTLSEYRIKNITLENLTVQNATYNGVFINGASNVNIIRCDFSENGVSVPPGPKLLHNLLLTRCREVTVKDSRLVTSPNGSGIALDHCTNVSVSNCEIARNGYYGLLISESKNITASSNLIEGNDRSGVMTEFLQNGSENINIRNNTIHYNNGYAVESYAAKKIQVLNNRNTGNGMKTIQENISNNKLSIME